MKKAVSILILECFFVSSIMGPDPVYAQEFHLPAPGVMVHLSPEFNPTILKGLKVHPDNPFRFDFILDQGDSVIASAAKQSFIKQESTRLIKYFLASLTTPEKDLWVNLSPYEKNRIVPDSFGQTEMGRDLLAEDYMLKQITASLIYPEDETGKRFWKRIYEEAEKKFGTTNIPVNTFNKVWIVPQKAVIYENAKAGTAYIVESRLKVMLEQDYLALAKNQRQPGDMASAVSPSTLPSELGLNAKAPQGNNRNALTNALGSQVVREIVIPELTKEVNEDKNFAQLRQVYNSLILATWYKKKIKDSILAQVYSDRNKVAGVNIDDPQEKEKIYQRYLQAFKKGVYNFIKEEQDPMTDQTVPRKYFAGGIAWGATYLNPAMTVVKNVSDSAMSGNYEEIEAKFDVAAANQPPNPSADQAMALIADHHSYPVYHDFPDYQRFDAHQKSVLDRFMDIYRFPLLGRFEDSGILPWRIRFASLPLSVEPVIINKDDDSIVINVNALERYTQAGRDHEVFDRVLMATAQTETRRGKKYYILEPKRLKLQRNDRLLLFFSPWINFENLAYRVKALDSRPYWDGKKAMPLTKFRSIPVEDLTRFMVPKQEYLLGVLGHFIKAIWEDEPRDRQIAQIYLLNFESEFIESLKKTIARVPIDQDIIDPIGQLKAHDPFIAETFRDDYSRLFRYKEIYEHIIKRQVAKAVEQYQHSRERQKLQIGLIGAGWGQETISVAILMEEEIKRVSQAEHVPADAIDYEIHVLSLDNKIFKLVSGKGNRTILYPGELLSKAGITNEEKDRFFENVGSAFRRSAYLNGKLHFYPFDLLSLNDESVRQMKLPGMDVLMINNVLQYIHPREDLRGKDFNRAVRQAFLFMNSLLKPGGMYSSAEAGHSTKNQAVFDEFKSISESPLYDLEFIPKDVAEGDVYVKNSMKDRAMKVVDESILEHFPQAERRAMRNWENLESLWLFTGGIMRGIRQGWIKPEQVADFMGLLKDENPNYYAQVINQMLENEWDVDLQHVLDEDLKGNVPAQSQVLMKAMEMGRKINGKEVDVENTLHRLEDSPYLYYTKFAIKAIQLKMPLDVNHVLATIKSHTDAYYEIAIQALENGYDLDSFIVNNGFIDDGDRYQAFLIKLIKSGKIKLEGPWEFNFSQNFPQSVFATALIKAMETDLPINLEEGLKKLKIADPQSYLRVLVKAIELKRSPEILEKFREDVLGDKDSPDKLYRLGRTLLDTGDGFAYAQEVKDAMDQTIHELGYKGILAHRGYWIAKSLMPPEGFLYYLDRSERLSELASSKDPEMIFAALTLFSTNGRHLRAEFSESIDTDDINVDGKLLKILLPHLQFLFQQEGPLFRQEAMDYFGGILNGLINIVDNNKLFMISQIERWDFENKGLLFQLLSQGFHDFANSMDFKYLLRGQYAFGHVDLGFLEKNGEETVRMALLGNGINVDMNHLGYLKEFFKIVDYFRQYDYVRSMALSMGKQGQPADQAMTISLKDLIRRSITVGGIGFTRLTPRLRVIVDELIDKGILEMFSPAENLYVSNIEPDEGVIRAIAKDKEDFDKVWPIVQRAYFFHRIDFLGDPFNLHIKESSTFEKEEIEDYLTTILPELIINALQEQKTGNIKVEVKDNTISIKDKGNIKWQEIQKKLHELFDRGLLYVSRNKTDGSIDQLARKVPLIQKLIDDGELEPANIAEIDKLFDTPEGKNILFFNRRGISFGEDKGTEEQPNGGYGLLLSRTLSARLGGNLRIADDGNRSGEVSFEIEFSNETPFTFSDQAMQTIKTLKNKEVLVVDNDMVGRMLARMALEEQGAKVIEAQNGREALEIINGRSKAFDLVLTDLQMPTMDGLTLISKVREKNKKIPIMLWTGAVLGQDQLTSFKKLGVELVRKPFNWDILLPRVVSYVNDRAMASHLDKGRYGGIDLTPAHMNLQTQNDGGEIKFHLDPAMLRRLQNAPGFVPVIINILPMTNLRSFLGMNDPVGVDKSV